jgi:hypothetical protein
MGVADVSFRPLLLASRAVTSNPPVATIMHGTVVTCQIWHVAIVKWDRRIIVVVAALAGAAAKGEVATQGGAVAKKGAAAPRVSGCKINLGSDYHIRGKVMRGN